jgi:hypothetical protein
LLNFHLFGRKKSFKIFIAVCATKDNFFDFIRNKPFLNILEGFSDIFDPSKLKTGVKAAIKDYANPLV